MVKLQNYKLAIANYCKLQITSLGLIHFKYVVWCFYGNKVSHLGHHVSPLYLFHVHCRYQHHHYTHLLL